MMIVGVFYLLALNWFLVAVSSLDSDRSMHEGKLQLERVWSLAAQPKYGDCWTKALEDINSRCQELTADQQSRIALKFTHCHLQRSGRPFPPCPEGAEVSSCTGKMDVVAFNAYTEFFTHTHSICHFLQSETWQHRAHLTMHRLSESSAGVAEQLESTRQMAEDIVEAQSATLQAQEDILRNGQELKHTLVQSTEDVRSVFSQMTDSSREQHVMMSELFNRMSFLHNFLLTETHSLSSVLFNAGALCLSFLLTATARTARARFVLLVLVCMNIYLERLIYQKVLDSERPSHQHMESVSVYVCMLRKSIVCVSVLALVYAFVRYRDPVQESLELLSQLRQTHSSLQISLKQAERRSLSASREGREAVEDRGEENLSTQRKGAERRGGERILRRTGELMAYNLSMITADSSIDQSQLSHSGMLSSTVNTSENTLLCPDITSSTLVHDNTTHNSTLHSRSTRNAPVSPGRRGRRSSCILSSSSSPVVYSVLVDKQRGEERKGGKTTEERSEKREKERDEDRMLILASNAAVSPGRRGRRSSCILSSSSSPVVYSVPVDKQRGEERKGGKTTEERSEKREKERDEDRMLILASNAAVSPGRRGRRSASILPSSSSPVIYSVPVEKQRGEDKIRGEMQTTEERSRRTEKERDEDAMLMFTHKSPGRRGRRTSASYILPSSSSSVVYNVLVDTKPRYSLRSRTSLSTLADT